MSAISRLYYGTQLEKNALQYLDGHENLILSLLDDKLSSALSKHLIGDRDPEHDPILEELGLLQGNFVTERGMRIVSTYPLLGTGEEKGKPYPQEFFPFLLSSILNGKVSARGDRFFQSGTFSAMFPSLEEDYLVHAGQKTIDAFRKLGIISRRGSWYKLNQEAAAAFMKLDEISRLAHVIYAESDLTTRRKGAKAITICFLLSGVQSLDWDILKAKLEGYAGTYIPTEDFLAFHILTEDERGTLTGTVRYGERTTTGVVSSDNEMSYRGYVPYEVWRIAEPVSADTLTRWMITKSSIKGALDTGMEPEEILSLLRRFSDGMAPETLCQRINTWVSQYQMARATRAVLLETDDRTNNILEQLPQMKEYILSHPAKNLFIMDSAEEDSWRKELEAIGYDMLGETKGPAFQEEDDVFGFLRLHEELDFPQTREVPFREEKYQSLLDSAKTKLQRAAIESHLVFEGGIRFKLSMTSGLYYNDKLSVIEKAISEKENLYYLDAELNEHLVKPLSLDKKDPENVLLQTDKELIPIGPIWKITSVPAVLK